MMFELESALRLARHHVAEGSRLVDEQSARVARMEPGSDETFAANKLLETMRSTLEIFVADLARLEAKAS